MLRRISILKFMGWIVVIAVAFAALRGANDHWLGGLVSFILCLLAYATLASILQPGTKRAVWLGFLVGCGGYFLAVRTLPRQDVVALPTTHLILRSEPWFLPYEEVVYGMVSTTTTQKIPNVSGAGRATKTASPGPPNAASVLNLDTFVSNVPTRFYSSISNNQANPRAFEAIGHALFALFFGEVAAMLAMRMVRSSSAERSIDSN